MIDKVTNTLILSSSFINNLGLMNGKMGIAIFLFHLSRYRKGNIYAKYAEELVDEIYKELSSLTPLNIENGLAGIGWGIEYLVKNNFIYGETDVILEDFDSILLEKINTSEKLTFLDEMVGIGLYFIMRYEKSNSVNLQEQSKYKALIKILEKLESKKMVHKKYDTSNKMEFLYEYVNSYFRLYFILETLRLDINTSISSKLLSEFEDELERLSKNQTSEIILLLDLLKEYSLKAYCNTEGDDKKYFKRGLKQICRETLNNEVNTLLNNNDVFKTKIIIGFIYVKLYKFSSEVIFLKEALYWKDASNNDYVKKKSKELNLQPLSTDLGILQGITGLALLNMILTKK